MSANSVARPASAAAWRRITCNNAAAFVHSGAHAIMACWPAARAFALATAETPEWARDCMHVPDSACCVWARHSSTHDGDARQQQRAAWYRGVSDERLAGEHHSLPAAAGTGEAVAGLGVSRREESVIAGRGSPE